MGYCLSDRALMGKTNRYNRASLNGRPRDHRRREDDRRTQDFRLEPRVTLNDAGWLEPQPLELNAQGWLVDKP